ncbi:MAG: hypothetical protein H0V78_03050, partial [Burkholderiales bacterium]|nr:hypothetical protein [Burkholderiales bacterium]
MTFWLLAGLVALLALLTLLPIWRYEAWWVRGQDFPALAIRRGRAAFAGDRVACAG